MNQDRIRRRRRQILDELDRMMQDKTNRYGTARFTGDLDWNLIVTMFDVERKTTRLRHMTKQLIRAQSEHNDVSWSELREELVDLAGYAVIAMLIIDVPEPEEEKSDR